MFPAPIKPIRICPRLPAPGGMTRAATTPAGAEDIRIG
jgi:hypothetical protein